MLDQTLDQLCCEPTNTFIILDSDLPIKVYSCIRCSNEWSTCHCKKKCKLTYGDSGSKYLICVDNKCKFIVPKCKKCNKLCRVERSMTIKNAGRLFWTCHNNTYHFDSVFGGWIDSVVYKYYGISNIYTSDYLCLISEYTEYEQFKKIITDVISIKNINLIDIHNELLRKNYKHFNVESLIEELRVTISLKNINRAESPKNYH